MNVNFGSKVLALACLAVWALPANAAISINPIADQTTNLGATLVIPLQFTSSTSEKVSISVDAGELQSALASGEMSIQPSQSKGTLAAGPQEINLTVDTKTYAPSFSKKKFSVVVTSASGERATVDISLTVMPVYIIEVVDGPNNGNDPMQPFDFKTQKDTAYFQAEPEGLQLIFVNESHNPLIVHGSGAIQHQGFTPLTKGQIYKPALILPAAGANVTGNYTIHGIYTPNRDAIFNATSIPGSR